MWSRIAISSINHDSQLLVNAMHTDVPDFLTIKEFARLIRVHPNTVRRGILRGRISAFRIGESDRSGFRIARSELNRLAVVDLEKIVNRIIDERIKE